eukprot:COSAG01_NODE_1174_length_11380_cov_2.922205_5_plen_113_part_00
MSRGNKFRENFLVSGICGFLTQQLIIFGALQRNDMRSFRYAGPDIDSTKSNVISINTDCVQLTLTQLTKRKVADKPRKPIHVNLTERAPQLAAFLRVYQPQFVTLLISSVTN